MNVIDFIDLNSVPTAVIVSLWACLVLLFYISIINKWW